MHLLLKVNKDLMTLVMFYKTSFYAQCDLMRIKHFIQAKFKIQVHLLDSFLLNYKYVTLVFREIML